MIRVVDAAQDLVLVAAVGDVGGTLQLALGLRNGIAQRPDRVALGVEPQLVEDAPQGRPGVVLVEDDKARHDADPLRLAAQDPDRSPVEGPDPHLLSRFADQRLDPAAHLPRGLVGERHRQQAVRPHPMGGDQVGDPGGQHTGLAAAGPGEDQERTVAVRDSFLLGRIQAREQGIDLGLGGLSRKHEESSLATTSHPPLPGPLP